MSIKKQLETIMRCLAAETEEDHEQARAELREMVGGKPAPISETHASVENIITTVLLELGVPCHIKGHPHLITAIGALIAGHSWTRTRSATATKKKTPPPRLVLWKAARQWLQPNSIKDRRNCQCARFRLCGSPLTISSATGT